MKRLLPIILVLVLLCSTAFAAGFEVPAEGYDGSEVRVIKIWVLLFLLYGLLIIVYFFLVNLNSFTNIP